MADATITVVSWETTFLHEMREILTGMGYRTVPWLDGGDTVAMLRERRPDLVVVDVLPGLPAANWPFLKQLRQQPGTQQLPIIACTSDGPALEEAIRRLHDTRCAVLSKPIALGKLRDQVSELLMMRLEPRRPVQPTPA